jgi:hypothetical protein
MLLIMNMMPDSSCRPSKSDQKIRITITSRFIFGYIIDLFFLCVIYLNSTIFKFYYFKDTVSLVFLFSGKLTIQIGRVSIFWIYSTNFSAIAVENA